MPKQFAAVPCANTKIILAAWVFFDLWAEHFAVFQALAAIPTQAQLFIADLFHFRILLLKELKGATVLMWMNLYTSQTAFLVASSAQLRM